MNLGCSYRETQENTSNSEQVTSLCEPASKRAIFQFGLPWWVSTYEVGSLKSRVACSFSCYKATSSEEIKLAKTGALGHPERLGLSIVKQKKSKFL